ncbi:MAG: hypothetical protein J3T61_01230 [Candidatus Brocadiales bacterium]|nr:hypothetical protein [Candidatus Bathyanammoxibius sp.]
MSGELEPIINTQHGDFDEEEMIAEIERESNGNLDYYRRATPDNHPALRRNSKVPGRDG